MFGFPCSRQLLPLKPRRTQLGFLLQNVFLIVKSFTSLGLSESNEKREEEKHSFAVSYLINSCGLSTKSAIFATQNRRLKFNNPERPDSVLNLLKENGFSNAQISLLVRRYPLVLLSNPEKTLLPKIEFFSSRGVSSSDLTKILSSNPILLKRSLKEHLIPCYDFLKSLLLVDNKVLKAFKGWAFGDVATNGMAPNIELLRQLGAPQSAISMFVANFPHQASVKHARFVEVVHQAMEIGCDPSKTMFIVAIHVLLKMSKEKLESKFELYKRWGWSKDMALSAFQRYPYCVAPSEEKITRAMDFLVNAISWPSADVARNPVVITLSFEKRIFPRCSVVQMLQSKGLVKNLSLGTFLQLTESSFVEKFVIRFQDDVPQLLNVYQGQIGLLDVGVRY